jgi:transcriptional regulator with XRE-family HTH domain
VLNPSKLKLLRLINDITQKELATEMGVSKNYISMVENGKRGYSQEQHDRYVNAIYKVSADKKKKMLNHSKKDENN